MAQPPLSDLMQFIDGALRALCAEKRIGTLFIITSRGQMIQFGLNEGEIVTLTCQNRHGLEALDILKSFCYQDIRATTFRFTDGVMPLSRSSVPLTEQVLELFQGQAAPAAENVPKSDWATDQVKQIVEQELVEFIGPMAAIVCDEVWSTADSLETALELLSRELSVPGQVERFRQNVLKRLT